MLLSYFPDQISLAGRPIMDKFIRAVSSTDTVVKNSMTADCAIIWSVLWQGRMLANKKVYETYTAAKKPIVILETGNLIRGKTYKVCLKNINRQGIHAYNQLDRLHKFSNITAPITTGNDILICCQQQFSLLWNNQPRVEQWVHQIVTSLRKQTDRPIVIRPHPRQQLVDLQNVSAKFKNVCVRPPIRNFSNDTTDFLNVLNSAYCVVGYNAGSVIEAAVRSVPICADQSSLCHDVSNSLYKINEIKPLTTNDWLKFIVQTEWFEDEIAAGTAWTILRSNILRGEY